MSYVITEADLPANKAFKSMDEFIQAIVERDRKEVMELLNIADDGSDALFVGARIIFRFASTGERHLFKLSPHRRDVPLKDLMRNGLGAVGRTAGAIAKGERITTSLEVRKERMAICQACAHFDKGKCKDVVVDGVTKKGCGCQLGLKVALATESCPQQKWLAVAGA